MTIQECYAQMGADYNEVFRRLYNEAMIRKFVLLFPKDDSFHNLEAALKEQNVKEAFRAAHTLKGVCQNLGFSNLYAPAVTLTETLRAGEQSGTLESCFQRLHAYYDRSAKTRAKIVSTLTYPVMVIIVAIVVFVIIIAVAVPAFTDAFTDLGSGSLPGVTRALMAVSAFFTKWWWLVLGVLALLVIAYLTFRRTERGRAALAAWSLTRAPLRRIHSMNAAAQFAHSMATLLAAGLPLPRALEVTANVVSNYTFSLAVRQVRQDVERGRPMAESMAGIECFPAMLTEMVGVGERSGALEETLDVIGGYYDNEVSVTTARLLAVLEPAITIALAVLVVLLLLAVYLPMFTLYGGI